MENQRTVTRPMDDLGRIVIPRDIREAFGWGDGTKLEITISDVTVKTVVIRERDISPCCSLCRAESENLVQVEKGYVCERCAEKVK